MKMICVIAAVFMGIAEVFAQDGITAILSEIENNNLELSVMRGKVEAEKAAYKADNVIQGPEIGFDYLWPDPVEIGPRKDFSITQSVDFAFLTGVGGRLRTSRAAVSDFGYSLRRQAVLLEAKKACIDLVYCLQHEEELTKRVERAYDIYMSYASAMESGDVDMVEVNKVHLSYLVQKNALRRNEAEINDLCSILRRLNGGKPVDVGTIEYPVADLLPADFDTWFKEVSSASPQLMLSKANVDVAMREKAVAKMLVLPEITAGYMAELVKGSNFRGLTVGLSIPLWSAKRQVRAANAGLVAARTEYESQNELMYAESRRLYDKVVALGEVMDELSSAIPLTQEAATLSAGRSKAGEISMLDAIVELSLYYDIIDEAMIAQRDYYQALCDLLVWEL